MEELELFQVEDLPVGVYEFVQLYIADKPCLYFGSADSYARDVLIAILNRHKLNDKDKMVQLRHGRGPAPRGERYSACGMGAATCITAGGPYLFGEKGKEYGETKLITLSGYSIDYGIGVDKKHLELIQEKHPKVEFLVTDYR